MKRNQIFFLFLRIINVDQLCDASYFQKLFIMIHY